MMHMNPALVRLFFRPWSAKPEALISLLRVPNDRSRPKGNVNLLTIHPFDRDPQIAFSQTQNMV
jgi:hypothetical protein